MYTTDNVTDFFVDIIFTTAHKAKGLEWSTVRLTDDFTAPEAGLMGKFSLDLFSSNLQLI